MVCYSNKESKNNKKQAISYTGSPNMNQKRALSNDIEHVYKDLPTKKILIESYNTISIQNNPYNKEKCAKLNGLTFNFNVSSNGGNNKKPLTLHFIQQKLEEINAFPSLASTEKTLEFLRCEETLQQDPQEILEQFKVKENLKKIRVPVLRDISLDKILNRESLFELNYKLRACSNPVDGEENQIIASTSSMLSASMRLSSAF